MRMGTKAHRALQLLLGLRNARIATALAAYGFTDEDLQEGWELLQALGKIRVDTVVPSVDTRAVQAIDQWENFWFPIADAALARRFPSAHAGLFLNLHQTDGAEATLSVQIFLDRVDAMSSADRAYGAEGTEAASWLAKRGLTPEIRQQARNLLALLRRLAEPEIEVPADQKIKLAKAEEALWNWYLEWSRTARTVIKQPYLLRLLGFRQDRMSSGGEPSTDLPEPASTRAESGSRL